MQIASIGIDLGKTTFHLVALGERNKVLVRKKFSRAQLLAYTANLQKSLIGVEAGAGAHFMGAALRDQGHEVRLIPAQFIKPYRKSNKNDFLDAEAIAEGVSKENMRFVQIKTEEQLDLQAMHRVRDRLVQSRTALINQIRGFLLERGITCARTCPKSSKMPSKTLVHVCACCWSVYGRNGNSWSSTSRRSPRRSSASARRMHSAGVYSRSPASALWSLPQLWRPSVMEQPFAEGATSQLGSVSCHDSTRPKANKSCSASANAATSICDACSSTVLER